MHLVGPAGGGIAIDGNHASRIFYITGGTASKPNTLANLRFQHGDGTNSYGGGIYNNGAVLFTNCAFAYNTAYQGGGLYTTGTASLNNCTLIGNTAITQGTGYGGGIFNAGKISLTNCTLSGNSADTYGGGLRNFGGTMELHRCTFRRNHAGNGGGIFNDTDSRVTVINCVFAGNEAGSGGGVCNNSSNTMTLTNCTFTANTASLGGIDNETGTITLTNCILYGDSGGEIGYNAAHHAVLTITYCDVQGGASGTGNMDADPLFVSPTVPRNLRLQSGSPCIDAGTPNGAPPVDRDGNPRDASPDIGAFEFQP